MSQLDKMIKLLEVKNQKQTDIGFQITEMNKNTTRTNNQQANYVECNYCHNILFTNVCVDTSDHGIEKTHKSVGSCYKAVQKHMKLHPQAQ